MPKVSICIPTYNRHRLLREAIDSALQQTFPDFEVIVCDDGSTDSTSEMMAQLHDSRIRYLRHPQNIGKSNNMISGFEAATGEYFIKFDDDDRLTPEFLTRTCAVLDSHPTVDFVSTDHWVIDAAGKRDAALTQRNSAAWGRTNLPAGVIEHLLDAAFVRQCMQIGATLFRRSTLQAVGYMTANWQNCEDNDLFVRLALAGKSGYYLPELLMEYRFHPEQRGLEKDIRYSTDKLRYLESYQFESPRLEAIRQSRLNETRLLLGMRLIEKGETQKGRALVRSSLAAGKVKAYTSLVISLLPVSLRQKVFAALRR